MSEAPRVSVLMTVYNGAKWLREAIDSIVTQTYTDWECVVIENGSSDASPTILASYTDPRIRVVAVSENLGRTPALRNAFDLARGEYFAVLDADDVADPARLAKEVAFLDANAGVSVVGSWMRRIDGDGTVFGSFAPATDPDHLQDQLGFANPIVHSSVMFRAALARDVGGYSCDYPYANDFALWLRMAEHAPIGMIGEFLGSHRSWSGNLTRLKESQLTVSRDTLSLLEYATQHLPLSPSARRRNREERTIASCRYAVWLLRSGEVKAASLILIHAVLSDPRGVMWNRITRALIG